VEGLEILGISIIFFVAYLYLPAAVLRLAAERYVDLQPARDSREIEDFIANVIPSGAIHLVTVLAMFAIRHGIPGMPHHPLGTPEVDWHFVGAFITGEEKWYVIETLQDRIVPTAIYFFCAIGVSIVSGRMYGATAYAKFDGYDFKREILTRADHFFEEVVQARKLGSFLGLAKVVWLEVQLIAFLLVELAYGLNFRLFTWLLQQHVTPMFVWTVRHPTMFVRTRDRLYFGRFFDYEKLGDGEIGSISIANAVRYCYDEIDQRIATGRLPIARMNGTLTIRWSEVIDIHEVGESHFETLVQRLTERRNRHVGSILMAHHAGKTVTLETLVTHYAAGVLTEEAIFGALTHLVDFRAIDALVGIDPPVKYRFPRKPRTRVRREQRQADATAPLSENPS
jgi:hypothetical protein